MTDYAMLTADVADWLLREDLTSRIPTFIRLAEASFNRTLRVTPMVSRSQTEADRKFIPLPQNWLETYMVSLDGAPVRYVTPEELLRLNTQSEQLEWTAYTNIDGGMEFAPEPSKGSLVVAYYAKIPSLSDSNQTNWLISNCYDAYLYGALVHSAPFLAEDERVPVWRTALNQVLDEIRRADERARYSGATLRQRTSGGYG